MLLIDDRFMCPRERVLQYRSRLLCFRVSVAMANGVAARRLNRDLTEVSASVFAITAIAGSSTTEQS
jgi:hypothetical protein